MNITDKNRALVRGLESLLNEAITTLPFIPANGKITKSIKMFAAKFGMKICTICNQPFPATAEYFFADSRVKDGLRAKCKRCHHQTK